MKLGWNWQTCTYHKISNKSFCVFTVLLVIYRYGKATFCLEELILSNPHHHLYHQRLAEVIIAMVTN